MSKPSNRPYSSQVVDGLEKAAARAMLHAVGFTEADFSKPQVGIASTWSNLTPCNVHINELAEAAAIGVEDAAAKAITFNTTPLVMAFLWVLQACATRWSRARSSQTP